MLQKPRFLTALLTAGLAAPYCSALAGQVREGGSTQTKNLPNIVIILADDLGYGDVGPLGSKDVKTTSLDTLAREGITFTNAYVTCPVCGPSRAGLLTGRYQQRFGFETNNGPEVVAVSHYGVPREERMLPEYLKEAGYVTGMVGKWHLGFKPELTPPQRGFDFFFGFHSGYHGYFPDQHAPWSGPIMRGIQPVVEKDYLSDAFAREAVDFIRKNSERPFFLYLPFNAVHSPLHVPTEVENRFAHVQNPFRRKTLAMITVMDDAIGRVHDALLEKNISDRTLIIFVSDNGGPGREASNGPLRGQKGNTYEGGIRVPMIMKWPGHLHSGSVYEKPVSTLDVLPTIFAAGTLPLPKVELDGVNLLPYLSGENKGAPHDTLYWRLKDKQEWRAIREGDWKMVSLGGAWELYNLQSDIGEKNNMAGDNSDRVKQLDEKWQKWNSRLIEPRWSGQAPPPGPDPSQQTSASASR